MRFIHLSRRSFRSIQMNTLFFTHQHRRSTKTLRLHYGLEGMKYIIQVYQGEINGHGEKEGLPTEYQYEFEQEILKNVHDFKSILEKREGAKKVNREFLNQFLIYDSIEKFKS